MKKIKIGDRFHAPASDWPNFPANEYTGGWPGTVTSINETHIHARIDADGHTYSWPRKIASQYHIPSIRVLEAIDGDGFGLKTTQFGVSVVATVEHPRWTFVASYPGRLFTQEQHERLVARGLVNTMYSCDMFGLEDRVVSGTMYRTLVDNAYILDPSLGHGIDPMFAHALGPRINEPPEGMQQNCVFVYNMIMHRLEIWTDSVVRRGEQLYVCYGSSEYSRTWRSHCSKEHMARGYTVTTHMSHPIQKPGYIPMIETHTSRGRRRFGQVTWVPHASTVDKQRVRDELARRHTTRKEITAHHLERLCELVIAFVTDGYLPHADSHMTTFAGHPRNVVYTMTPDVVVYCLYKNDTLEQVYVELGTRSLKRKRQPFHHLVNVPVTSLETFLEELERTRQRLIIRHEKSNADKPASRDVMILIQIVEAFQRHIRDVMTVMPLVRATSEILALIPASYPQTVPRYDIGEPATIFIDTIGTRHHYNMISTLHGTRSMDITVYDRDTILVSIDEEADIHIPKGSSLCGLRHTHRRPHGLTWILDLLASPKFCAPPFR